MIVIIGGNGFIGKHVRALLREQSEPALIVSRRPEQVDAGERFVSAEALFQREGARAFSRATGVIFLAGGSAPATFVREPWREISANVEPAISLFSQCAELNP